MNKMTWGHLILSFKLLLHLARLVPKDLQLNWPLWITWRSELCLKLKLVVRVYAFVDWIASYVHLGIYSIRYWGILKNKLVVSRPNSSSTIHSLLLWLEGPQCIPFNLVTSSFLSKYTTLILSWISRCHHKNISPSVVCLATCFCNLYYLSVQVRLWAICFVVLDLLNHHELITTDSLKCCRWRLFHVVGRRWTGRPNKGLVCSILLLSTFYFLIKAVELSVLYKLLHDRWGLFAAPTFRVSLYRHFNRLRS